MAVPVEGEEPLYRIPGWELLDRQCRETWGCSLATLVGAANLGMAVLYTPPPVPGATVGLDVTGLLFHGTAALLLLLYGWAY